MCNLMAVLHARSSVRLRNNSIMKRSPLVTLFSNHDPYWSSNFRSQRTQWTIVHFYVKVVKVVICCVIIRIKDDPWHVMVPVLDCAVSYVPIYNPLQGADPQLVIIGLAGRTRHCRAMNSNRSSINNNQIDWTTIFSLNWRMDSGIRGMVSISYENIPSPPEEPHTLTRGAPQLNWTAIESGYCFRWNNNRQIVEWPGTKILWALSFISDLLFYPQNLFAPPRWPHFCMGLIGSNKF